MKQQANNANLLGEQIAIRLQQLGMSRREFCRRFSISRQTMHDLEHAKDGQGFADSTFAAIDFGLKWQAGTAKAFHEGNPRARETLEASTKERIDAYLERILQHVYAMSIDELEREVLMLEEEAYGRSLPVESGAAMKVIRSTVERLSRAMLESSAQEADSIDVT